MTAPANDLNALSTLEAQVLAACTKMQVAEQAMPELTQVNNVSIVPDLDGKTVNISVTLPITFSMASGTLEIVAVDYTTPVA